MNEYLLNHLVTEIELPERAYELAKKRYDDLGGFLTRAESNITNFNPNVAPQGSFRLGTAIRPIGNEEYDVDLSCVLRNGLTEKNISQKTLKELVGEELKIYRAKRNINAPIDEKRRCWRLIYADELSFHLDIVPGIPAPDSQRLIIKSNIIRHRALLPDLHDDLSNHALYITDNEDPNFEEITDPWHISNPEGYAQWFESRMMLSQVEDLFKANVADIPSHTRKTPLQQLVQLLKRHRDVMYSQTGMNTDLQPISIIITTLAAQAYRGEANLIDAVRTIPLRMEQAINSTEPRVPNPVNPKEDFADKWKSEPLLERAFRNWLAQVKRDLDCLTNLEQQVYWKETVKDGFKITLSDEITSKISQRTSSKAAVAGAATTVISPDSPKPWGSTT